jgi:DNA-binding response OmpR family regulator
MSSRVLVVEDDRPLAKVLMDNLSLDGFEVVRAADAHSAVSLARDFMLPDRSGFEIFETLHQDGRTPVIFLTARGQTSDKLRGLNLGGDDYITKPFDLQEFLARVHAVLRRARTNIEQVMLGAVSVDFVTQTATKGKVALHLTYQELTLLRYLATRAGKVVYRSELLRAVWGYPNDPHTRSVDHAVARLRKKIEPDPDIPRYIRTVHGDGYSLTPDSINRGTARTGRRSDGTV